jgi:hypothetical protein
VTLDLRLLIERAAETLSIAVRLLLGQVSELDH